MEIRRSIQNADLTTQKKRLEGRGAGAEHGINGKSESGQGDTPSLSLSRSQIDTFIAQAKEVDPSRLHKLADIQAQLNNNSYDTSAEGLVDHLLDNPEFGRDLG